MLHKTSLARIHRVGAFFVLFDRTRGFSEQNGPGCPAAIQGPGQVTAAKPEELTYEHALLSEEWQSRVHTTMLVPRSGIPPPP
jgi:hypothetical protein